MAIVAILIGVALIVVVIYVVAKASGLQATTRDLQEELKKFKEDKFDGLIREKLSLLTDKASQEIDNREKIIREVNTRLADEDRKAREAAERFKDDLGEVRARIAGLSELQGKVGELNDLLKPQQLRGELGEVIIRTLIADKLPHGSYEEDHVFADGKKVEFVIRVDGKLIPIDSKLQLEDFKRMREAPEDRRNALRAEFKRKVRQKIDEVRDYIRPTEGTYPFAFMAIPSEAVYYELIAQKDFVETGGLYEYAREQKVFLVSPLTFWAYLTVIAQGLQGFEIGRRAEDILASLETIASRIQGFTSDEFRVLGEHLRNAKSKYDEAQEKLQELGSELTTLKRLKAEQPTEQGVTI